MRHVARVGQQAPSPGAKPVKSTRMVSPVEGEALQADAVAEEVAGDGPGRADGVAREDVQLVEGAGAAAAGREDDDGRGPAVELAEGGAPELDHDPGDGIGDGLGVDAIGQGGDAVGRPLVGVAEVAEFVAGDGDRRRGGLVFVDVLRGALGRGQEQRADGEEQEKDESGQATQRGGHVTPTSPGGGRCAPGWGPAASRSRMPGSRTPPTRAVIMARSGGPRGAPSRGAGEAAVALADQWQCCHYACMAEQITIRGVPEEVSDTLAERAALQRLSMQVYLRDRTGADRQPALR